MPRPDPRKAARPPVQPSACAARPSAFSGYPESLHNGDSDRTSWPSPCHANRFAQHSYIVLHGASSKNREAATLSGASPHRVEKCCLFPAASYRLSAVPIEEQRNRSFPQRAIVEWNETRSGKPGTRRNVCAGRKKPVISHPCACGCAWVLGSQIGPMLQDRREAVSSGRS